MVEQSELAWRLLCRRHGANLAFTPMMHAQMFVKDAHYRREHLLSQTHPLDHPLIAQFCANSPHHFVAAGLIAQELCDGVDLNLGCPQMIARRGHYGAYLQDDWELIHSMVVAAVSSLRVPVSCKLRIFPDQRRTVAYARMLESAGCRMLTVHGRTREQLGHLTGLADWDQIRAVRLAVRIPVLANGNVSSLGDAQRLAEYTGARGVMSAEGLLHNPFLFEGGSPPPVWEAAAEFLSLEEELQNDGRGQGRGLGGGGGAHRASRVRSHLYRLWHHAW
ncbi:tRNA-dihydrouridine(16/17) synthase [NAD(P)(+)]-like, partial [Petromyzon marinus]|uniref:tRNA-dihydrouridine(16/17) synthase [NAD(P)(+)]-like n=1 Tax=Petromyzon marinus TaxID=7757 RepID=UPI003F6FF195